MVYCEDTVTLMMERFMESGHSVQEEIEEVKGAISNERLWLLGSDTEEERQCHMQNIADDEELILRLQEMAV